MKVTRVIDADTIGVEMVVRLAGIYAPERDTIEGKTAIDFVKSVVVPGAEVDVRWYFPEARYNRPAADIIIKGTGRGDLRKPDQDLGELLVLHGHASKGLRPKAMRIKELEDDMREKREEWWKLTNLRSEDETLPGE